MGWYFLVLGMVLWEAHRHLKSYECICPLLCISKTVKYRELRWNTYFLNRAQVLKADLSRKHMAWCFQLRSKCEINLKMIIDLYDDCPLYSKVSLQVHFQLHNEHTRLAVRFRCSIRDRGWWKPKKGRKTINRTEMSTTENRAKQDAQANVFVLIYGLQAQLNTFNTKAT